MIEIYWNDGNPQQRNEVWDGTGSTGSTGSGSQFEMELDSGDFGRFRDCEDLCSVTYFGWYFAPTSCQPSRQRDWRVGSEPNPARLCSRYLKNSISLACDRTLFQTLFCLPIASLPANTLIVCKCWAAKSTFRCTLHFHFQFFCHDVFNMAIANQLWITFHIISTSFPLIYCLRNQIKLQSERGWWSRDTPSVASWHWVLLPMFQGHPLEFGSPNLRHGSPSSSHRHAIVGCRHHRDVRSQGWRWHRPHRSRNLASPRGQWPTDFSRGEWPW